MFNRNVMHIGESGFDSFKYPGGEIQVRLRPETIDDLEDCDGVVVSFRIKSSEDIMKLLLLQDAIDSVVPNMPPSNKAVVIPYLPYSRADRRFVEGDCLGKKILLDTLKTVWPLSKIYTFDCHSSRFEKDYYDISPRKILNKILSLDPEANIIFPDEGAKNRYAEMLDGDRPVYFCQKKRDPVTGKFLGFEVPEIADTTKNSYIIDDICDGGGTFLGIAEKLQIPNLRLYVSHGIFSKGFDDLLKFFDRIYTTNSFEKTYKDLPENVEVHDIFDYLREGAAFKIKEAM